MTYLTYLFFDGVDGTSEEAFNERRWKLESPSHALNMKLYRSGGSGMVLIGHAQERQAKQASREDRSYRRSVNTALD